MNKVFAGIGFFLTISMLAHINKALENEIKHKRSQGV
jgi:hypothetical protein